MLAATFFSLLGPGIELALASEIIPETLRDDTKPATTFALLTGFW